MLPVLSYGDSLCDLHKEKADKHLSRITEIDWELLSERTKPFNHKSPNSFKVWSDFKLQEAKREHTAWVDEERQYRACKRNH